MVLTAQMQKVSCLPQNRDGHVIGQMAGIAPSRFCVAGPDFLFHGFLDERFGERRGPLLRNAECGTLMRGANCEETLRRTLEILIRGFDLKREKGKQSLTWHR